MLKEQVGVSEVQVKLLNELFPGPFTVILPSKHSVSTFLESEKETLGVRIPNYSFITGLVNKFGRPVSATSANLSGRSAHYSVNSLLNKLPESKKNLIDLIIDRGQLPRNKPSTIVDLTTPKIKILRQGDIVLKDRELFISNTPAQTKKISQYLFHKLLKIYKGKPLIFIIEGELGVGKTVFVKGIAEALGINNVISPTYVVYYEYFVPVYPAGGLFKNKLIHIDLYNIEDMDEFKHLGLEKYLEQENVLCFEWGEKAAEIMNILKKKGKIIYVKIKYVNEKTRELNIRY